AQSRIAFIDGTKLVKRMPEAVDAESRLDQIITGWNKELSDLEADLKRKREDYDRKRLIMAEAERTAVENDITELKNRIDRFRQEKYGTSGELYKQQAELMKPAYDRLMKAIEEVAVEGKYDYVFDRGAKDYSILYTNAKFDLSLPVAKKLGLETSDIFNIPLLNNPLNPGKPSPNNPGSTPPDPRNQPVPPPMNPGEMQPGQVPPPLPH
ncbi:MAG: OmpH family outer membrane protein, partial [Ignavibacteriota bacterium]